jgi:hypothetical protein
MILRWQDSPETDNTPPTEDSIFFVPVGIHYGGKGLRKTVHVKIGKPLSAGKEAEAPRLTNRIMENIARLSGLPRARVPIEAP